MRFGASMTFSYQWFERFLPIGNRFSTLLDHGTIYFMGKIAVGNEWKKSSIRTLRHCAGRGKYAMSNDQLRKKQNKSRS
jgi:hypothetical protein